MAIQKAWKVGMFVVAGLLLAAPTAKAATIPLVDIPNDPTYSWSWAEDLSLGYSFTVTGSVTFNALAVFDVIEAESGGGTHVNSEGLNASHQVAVWDALGNQVVSTTVAHDGPTAASQNTYGNWVYQLVAPTTLTTGTYTIGAFYAGNSDPVMVRQESVVTLPGITYVAGNYLYSSAFARPTGTYPTNESQYFGPTMLSVPDGGMTLTLLGGALAGLGVLRRRRLL